MTRKSKKVEVAELRKELDSIRITDWDNMTKNLAKVQQNLLLKSREREAKHV